MYFVPGGGLSKIFLLCSALNTIFTLPKLPVEFECYVYILKFAAEKAKCILRCAK